MNKYQKQIKSFADKRGWQQFHNPKDLLLGIVEEIGELRNLIKWEQDSEKIRNTLIRKKDDVQDTIGDIYWFLALLANQCQINIDCAISQVIKENRNRFPLSKTKNRHTNIHIGGHNGKRKP